MSNKTRKQQQKQSDNSNKPDRNTAACIEYENIQRINNNIRRATQSELNKH